MGFPISRHTGFALVELLLALAIAALLILGLTGVVGGVLTIQDDTRLRNDATREARFAMQRMVTAVRRSDRLLLPLADNPNTNWREHVREQTVPASAPEGSSTLATAVLAVTLDASLDIDEDGFADSDNDQDSHVDEDLGNDNTNDGAPGIKGIDDDGDGAVDEGDGGDNDEDGVKTEDSINGVDDDGDGSVDEDIQFDMNRDNAAGIAGVDDDGDGTVDEGTNDDDDEDGSRSEDWFDAVVFYLSGSTLLERRPNLNPVDGTDYTEFPIADNVTHFRVERVPNAGKRAVLVDITLELTLPDGEPISLNTRVRVGGAP